MIGRIPLSTGLRMQCSLAAFRSILFPGGRRTFGGCLLLMLLLMLLSETGGAAPAPSPLAPAETGAHPSATLRIGNREIIVLRATIAGASPAHRVQAAKERVASLPDSALRESPSVRQIKVGDESGVAVLVGSTPLFLVLQSDLDPLTDYSLIEAAAMAVKNLTTGLQVERQLRRPEVLARGVALSLLASLAFLFAAWSILHLRARLGKRLAGFAQRKLERVLVPGIDVRAQLVLFLGHLTTLALWLAVLFAAYLWLTFVLRRFPYTEPWGDALAANVFKLLSGMARSAIQAAPGLLVVLVIVMLAQLTVQLISAFFQSVEQKKITVHFMYPDTARATRWLLVGLTWLFALAIAYPYIPGSDSAAFQGISVVAGLMVTLGSAGIINQAMSGLVLVYSRALIQGEFVQVDDVQGIVTHVGLLTTTIKTHSNEHITIPNAVIVGSKIKNYTRLESEQGAMLTTSVSIGYDTSWRQVTALLIAAARNTPGIRQDIAPQVLQRELTDFYVKYELVAGIMQPHQHAEVLNLLLGEIQDAFNQYGVQIMSPNFEAQPEYKVVVPKEQWFAPPAREPGTH